MTEQTMLLVPNGVRTIVPGTLPNNMLIAQGYKLLPLIVTVVPPAVDPVAGLTLVIDMCQAPFQ